jgi:hypothetical protein
LSADPSLRIVRSSSPVAEDGREAHQHRRGWDILPAVGLAAGLLVGVGLTQPGRAAAAAPSGGPSVPSDGGVAVAPGVPAATTAQAGSTIAYPFFGGSPGIAPDHTIVVTGVGQVDMASDGADRATAQKSALIAALADAKAQADVIASATKLSISTVLSVSASVSPFYGVMPMMGAAGGSSPAQPVPPMAPQPAYPQTIGVSVTVESRVS